MKRFFVIFTIILLSYFVSGCETNVPYTETIHKINGKETAVFIFDSCEYVRFGGYSQSAWGGHKGNCKFCAERAKNALKDTNN